MKLTGNITISNHTVNAIIERNDLSELIKLHERIGLAPISQHTRNWYFACYLGAYDNITSKNPRIDWGVRSKVIDSILTHPEWRNRKKIKSCDVLALKEVN